MHSTGECNCTMSAGWHDAWQANADNDSRDKRDDAAYNFRSEKQEDDFKNSGHIPPAAPSIYNHKTVDFPVNAIRPRQKEGS